MTKKVKYVGDADVRQISKHDLKNNQDFEGKGKVPEPLEWSKKNMFELELPDELADLLTSIDGNLIVEGEESVQADDSDDSEEAPNLLSGSSGNESLDLTTPPPAKP